jgi:hypothetical protein
VTVGTVVVGALEGAYEQRPVLELRVVRSAQHVGTPEGTESGDAQTAAPPEPSADGDGQSQGDPQPPVAAAPEDEADSSAPNNNTDEGPAGESGPIDLELTDDTFARGGAASDWTSGNVQYLMVGDSVSESFIWRTFIKFDLTRLDGPVSEAALSLNTRYIRPGQEIKNSIAVVKGQWKESTLSWENAPSQRGKVLTTWRTASNETVVIDVREAINAALADGEKSISFEIFAQSGQNTYGSVSYHSGETDFGPALVVVR